ncbi:hypothetical protein G6F43_007233 [Rhizopus delemar]|nr:hypothetical protein G6F43_007233 [Rhizopus delemar]
MEITQLIKLVCPFCDEQNSFEKLQNVQLHCRRKHAISLPSRTKGHQPPKDSKRYTKALYAANPSILVKLICPCCPNLFFDKSPLKEHVVKEHNILFPINLENSAYEEESYVHSPESFSSVEDVPWRTTRTLVNVPNDDIDSVSHDNDEGAKIGSVDISDFLNDFRNKSIQYNLSKLYKELSLARILSIHYVYYFPLISSKSCIAYLTESDVIQAVYDDLKSDSVLLSSDIVLWATNIQLAIDSDDRFSLEHEFGSLLISASNTKSTILVDAAHILISLTRTMLTHRKQPKRGAEDTFAHRFVAPFLNNIFYGNNLESLWANSQMAHAFHQESSSSSTWTSSPVSPSSSSASSSLSVSHSVATPSISTIGRLQPDFTSSASVLGHRIDLFVVEIKPPNSSSGHHDFVKLAKEMMLMINQLIRLGLESPIVCGLWIDGYYCISLKMDLRANGIYRLVEVDKFELPKSTDDLTKVRTITQKLLKIKMLIDKVIADIERNIKKRKSYSSSLSPSLPNPNVQWVREPFTEKRVKKIKLNNVK